VIGNHASDQVVRVQRQYLNEVGRWRSATSRYSSLATLAELTTAIDTFAALAPGGRRAEMLDNIARLADAVRGESSSLGDDARRQFAAVESTLRADIGVARDQLGSGAPQSPSRPPPSRPGGSSSVPPPRLVPSSSGASPAAQPRGRPIRLSRRHDC
jgi:hypothetical protein